MKNYLLSLVAVFTLVACPPTTLLSSLWGESALANPVTDLTTKFKGQTVYVSVYSHIYHENENRAFNLAANLSIRNTDLNGTITVTSVSYYNTEGKLIKNYLDKPVTLAPLASLVYVVQRRDTTGGSGANFIVEWNSPQPLSEPIIEAVMVSAGAGQGIAFISVGKPIKSY